MRTPPDDRWGPAGELRILIVDDEEGARLTLTDVLMDLGYVVHSAGTAGEALALARQQEFHIALLDVRLPDMFGTELLRRIKALHPAVSCVMVTAYASVASTVEALNEGACAYVMKPFELTEIMAVIRDQAEKQRLARENQRFVQTLAAMQAISDIALSTLDLHALPGKLVDRVVADMGAGAGALVLTGHGTEPGHPLIRLGEADGAAAQRALDERLPLLLPSEEAATSLAMPLLARSQCIGGLQIDAPAGRHFTRRDLRMAALLADRMALAIDNARLHERERRSAREATTLLRLSESLVSALHLDDRLHTIASTLAEVAGCARCLVFLNRDGSLLPAGAHGITLDEMEAFGAMNLDLLRIGGPIQGVYHSGHLQVIQNIEATTESGRAFLALWRIRSALAIPLVIGAQAIGAALLYTPGEDCLVPPHDIRLCEAVANQAAIAIENARAFERERNVAEVLQRSFLPPAPEHLGTLQIAVRYHAALAEAEVGGDFYDIIDLPDGRIGLLMADVSGKGVAAAVHAAMGKYMLRAFAFEYPDPAEALTRLNQALFAYSTHEVFITMFFAVIDMVSGEVSYVSAGHPPALLVRTADPNRMVRLGSTAPPVGAFREPVGALSDSMFAADSVHLAPGDLLVAYTDGVTEARRGQEFFGIERVEDVVAENAQRGPDGTADAIYDAVNRFTGRGSHDDIALIVAKALPREEAN